MGERKKMPSGAEMAILRVLWDLGRGTAREVHEALNAGRAEKRVVTTTAKMLQIMMEKELVERDDSTWPHIYQARVAKKSMQRSVLRRAVVELFEASASQFLLTLLETGKPNEKELAEIKSMLADYEKGIRRPK